MFRRRRRNSRFPLLLGLALLLFQRRLFRQSILQRGGYGRLFGWRGLARDYMFLRYPIFTPTGIAMRVASRFFRRFRV